MVFILSLAAEVKLAAVTAAHLVLMCVGFFTAPEQRVLLCKYHNVCLYPLCLVPISDKQEGCARGGVCQLLCQ